MIRAFVPLAVLLIPASVLAADARIAFKTTGGQVQSVLLTAPVCGTDASGSPLLCGSGGSALMAYKTTGGQYQSILPIVPVCSVTADGTPETCDFSGGSADLSAYLTKTDAQAEYPQLTAQNSFTAEQHFSYAYFADPDNNVQRDAKFGDKGIAVGGGTKTDTLNVTGAASTGALTVTGNITEQGIPTFTNSSGQVNGQITGSTVKWYLNRNSNRTYTMLNTYTTSGWVPFMFNDDGTLSTTVGTMANLGADVEFLKTLTVDGVTSVPDTTTTDSSKSALNTESAAARFVSNTERGSVTGDLSASGSSLTVTLGASGLQFVMSYSASGTGSLSAVSASGSLTPVDIYETAAWGTTSFKGYTLDSGTITTTPTVVDSTFYLTSNAWGTYHVGVGGHLYIVDIFGSGAGKRTIIAWRKVS